MEINFHYYVTYTAAYQAGFSKEDAATLARAAQYVDECYDVTVQGNTRIFFSNLMDTLPFYYGEVRELLGIWPVFHFLPGDYARIEESVDPAILGSKKPIESKAPELICGTESATTRAIVENAKIFWNTAVPEATADEESNLYQQKLLRVGITMHVLADTFAHQGFAGVALGSINEVAEVRTLELKGFTEEMKDFSYGVFDKSPSATNSSFGYLGHGRIGHVPDYPGATFSCQIQWRKALDKYMVRCNPMEYYCAYLQMIEAMRYIRGDSTEFSNQVDRAMLLDSRHRWWEGTKKMMDVFNAIGTDAALVRPWFLLMNQVPYPADYTPYPKGSTLHQNFVTMAEAFRTCVFSSCGALNRYYKLVE